MNQNNACHPPVIKRLGRRDYSEVWQAMQNFNEQRTDDSADELWCVEHPPVFTLGLNGKPEHILDAGDIPVVQCDRGGQVTFHGPGQLVIYTLLDIRRLNLGVKQLVTLLEQAVIDLLHQYRIDGQRKAGAPGIYVDGAKIAALGLRIKRGCSYHGLSLNVDMDQEPFSRINPCGYQGLGTVQLKDLTEDIDIQTVTAQLTGIIQQLLSARDR